MAEYSPKSMTEEEMLRIWKHLSIKTRMIAKCCYYLQLRPNESRRLRLRDFRDGLLILPNQKNKVLNEAYPIPKPLLKDLRAYVQLFKKEIEEYNGYLFFSGKTAEGCVAANSFANCFFKAKKRAGFGDEIVYQIDKSGRKWSRISPHAHKVKAIQKVYMKTRDPIAVQSLAHHKDMRSTLRYLGNPMNNLDLKKDTISKTWDGEKI